MLTDLLWGVEDTEEARMTLVFFAFVFFRVPGSTELFATEREESAGRVQGVIVLSYHL